MSESKKIKILFCSPYSGAVGGITRWTEQLLGFYKTINSSVELEPFYVPRKNIHHGATIIFRTFYGLKIYIPFLAGLKKRITLKKYDVVHFCSSASISLIKDIFSIYLAKKNGIKTVIHFHFGRIPDIYIKKNWEQILLNKVITMADKVIVIDKASYCKLIERKYHNIELLPNPLAPRINEIIKINSNIAREDRKILFAGHIIPAKGVFELIDACKNLDNIKLRLIGHVSEQMKTRIQNAAGNNCRQWLEIAGEKSTETTIKEMLSAAVFVLPTYSEGFPNVIIESMACACPIVTTPVGAIPEMLDIENGYNYGICVETHNPVQLKDAIVKMLDDREYALKCGLDAKQRVNELYSMSIVWNKLINIWYSVLNLINPITVHGIDFSK